MPAGRGRDVPPSLSITTPAGPVAVGVPVPVSVRANPGVKWVIDPETRTWEEADAVTYLGGFEMRFDTGEVVTTTKSWSATVTFAQAGVHTATASVATKERKTVQSKPETFVAGTPSLTVTAPVAGDTVALGEGGADVTVEATSPVAGWFGGLAVTAFADG